MCIVNCEQYHKLFNFEDSPHFSLFKHFQTQADKTKANKTTRFPVCMYVCVYAASLFRLEYDFWDGTLEIAMFSSFPESI